MVEKFWQLVSGLKFPGVLYRILIDRGLVSVSTKGNPKLEEKSKKKKEAL